MASDDKLADLSKLKLVTAPSVYVLGRQTVDESELDRFLSDLGVTWESDSEVAAEVLTETAGRVCYLSFAKPRPGGNAAYLHHIKEVGHGSVYEHSVWNLLITGVSRSLTHELVRHRAGISPSMLSQRYVDESVAEYVVPPDLREEIEAAEGYRAWVGGYMETSHDSTDQASVEYFKHHTTACPTKIAAGEVWLESVNRSHRAYRTLAEYLTTKATKQELVNTEARKFARQAARSVLPNATETKIFITANGRALRHFIEQRGSRFAEPEIRQLAEMILLVLQKESPNLFSDYQLTALPDGTNEITTEFKKV